MTQLNFKPVDDQLAYLKKGIAEIIQEEQLKADLEKSRKTVEDACGVKVTSFRAPDFSIVSDNLWALETLAELGFQVDSSIFPMKMRRYGVAGWGSVLGIGITSRGAGTATLDISSIELAALEAN